MRRKSPKQSFRSPNRQSLKASPFSSPSSSSAIISSPYQNQIKVSPWKDAFKKLCLERARQKRQQMITYKRTHDTSERAPYTKSLHNRSIMNEAEMQLKAQEFSPQFNDSPFSRKELTPIHLSPVQGLTLSKYSNNTVYSNSNVSNTAWLLVQEELHKGNLSVSPSAHMHNHIFTQKPFEYRDGDYILQENELLELMQEIQEELDREEACFAEEVSCVENQHNEQKDMMEHWMNEQIADYEQWEQQQHQNQNMDIH